MRSLEEKGLTNRVFVLLETTDIPADRYSFGLGVFCTRIKHNMPLSLPDESGFHSFESGLRDRVVGKIDEGKMWLWDMVDKIRHFKIFKITVIHWGVLVTWIGLLLHFTSVYRSLYRSSALLATMCSNVLLFGTSDCLAQCISCFMCYKVDPVPKALDDMTKNIMSGLGSHRRFSRMEEDDDYNDNDDMGSDDASIFNDYGIQRDARHPDDEYRVDSQDMEWMSDFDSDVPDHELFSFYRWVCFMCWGWILSFCQVPWYKFLNYLYTEDHTFVQVLERVLTDQLVYSPISLYCFFMYSNYIMEHGDAASFETKIRNIYVSTLGCNYLVWPMVQFINFLLVPKHLQVPFSSSVGVLWNCFLSMRNSSNAA